MSTSIKTRIKNKIDTAQNWKSQPLSSLVLLSGEVAFEKSASDGAVNFKVGDGVQQYADLPYAMTKTYVKDTTSQEYADGKQSDLSVIKLSKEEYASLLHDDASQPNALYVISSDFQDAFGQQVKNVAPGTDLSDAATVEQVNAVSSQLSDYSLTSHTHSQYALTSHTHSNYVPTSRTVAGMQLTGNVQLKNLSFGSKNYNGSTALTVTAGDLGALTTHQPISAAYVGQHIMLSANGQLVGDIDCNDFIKDGMLSAVELCGTVLVMKFNTDAGSDPISVELSNFVDNYDSKIDALSDAINNKVFVLDNISGISGYSDLSVVKLSADEYASLLTSNALLSNCLYVVEDDYIDAYGEQIKNVAPPTDLSDAVNKEYVDGKIQEIEQDSGNFLDKRYGGTVSGTVEIRDGGSFAAGEGAQAFGENSFAAGENSYAGSRGWYYKAVDTAGKKIYLTDTQRAPSEIKFGSDIGQVTPDSGFTVDNSVIGKRICLVNKNKDDFGSVTVSAVENSTVLAYSGNLVNLSVNVVEGSLDYDDYSVIVSEAPYAGVLDNISKNSFASGRSAIASGRESHAEGRDTFAQGNYSHAEGRNTKALAYVTHAEGIDTFAGLYGTVGSYSHAEGNGVSAIGYTSHAEGYKTTASGSTSHAEGNSTAASGAGSHTEGYKTVASGDYSHAEGNAVSAVNECSHAEGNTVLASGIGAHAEGLSSLASGNYSHAEGGFDKSSGGSAIGAGSHAEGMLTLASGIVSHAEGNQTQASASGAHAEGQKSVASGNYSHAEGNATSAMTEYSHAEGNGSIVSGLWSHAEGYQTSAFGNYSHAEGRQTVAGKAKDGDVAATYAAHAEGFGTKALGVASHAEGHYVEASNDYEHAQGQYNKSNKASGTFGNAGNTLHSIGIGTSNSNRKNAVEVMQNGDIYIKGIGNYDGTTIADKQNLAQVISSILHQLDGLEAALHAINNGGNA